MNKVIRNPILTGFNPDPSIIRVGEDYYIATSTFEWFPGVQIHHSKDLINWELIGRPLNRLNQLDMKGNPDSCGVWAPCLSYSDGVFYLVYSNVRSFDGVWKDTPNFLVTTTDIRGDWSDPIFLSSTGFDGSLFHDENGQKWFTSMIVDHRKGKFFGGIILQELDLSKERLVGPVHHIFSGSTLGITEAPHLYQRNGYYYLMTAEGGTEYGHAVSLARSKSIEGPYELHPQNPVISASEFPDAPLQKCGHADIVDTPGGQWYAVFLTGRPLTKLGRCTLGRETAIEAVEWRADDWLYMKEGVESPRLEVPIGPGKGSEEEHAPTIDLLYDKDDFDSTQLNIHFQSLRIPFYESWITLKDRPGYLRLFGRDSLSSLHQQSLIARRVKHFDIEASTEMEFFPDSFQQMAGLVAYYNTAHWYYLHVMGSEDGRKKYLQILECDNFNTKESLENPIEIKHYATIELKVHFHYASLQFYFRLDGTDWVEVGPVLDGSKLSDDYVREGSDRYRPAFTGAFVGLCCQDLTGVRKHADFNWFEYKHNS